MVVPLYTKSFALDTVFLKKNDISSINKFSKPIFWVILVPFLERIGYGLSVKENTAPRNLHDLLVLKEPML